MLCADIADYLATNGHGTVAVSIFIGNLLDSPDNAICLTQSAGRPPHPVGEMESPNLQIMVRNSVFSTGEALIEAIYNLLHAKTHTTINTRMYYYIGAQGAFAQMPDDDAGRHIWVCNFIVNKLVE